MIETHPFGNFIPPKAKYLLLGSFAGKPKPGYDWFYCSSKNQFWPIIEQVYGVKLRNKSEKQKLFARLRIAVADIILQCERKANNNSDTNLANFVFNTKALTKILRTNKIETVFFSSRFVEHLFNKHFKTIVQQHPKIKLVTLPSPSPRYAAMNRQEKINRYKELLPKLKL